MAGNETAITRYESGEITQFRPPAQVLAEAKQAATALTEVIKLKKNPVMFNGEQYLEFEDWQTVGKFYGCTVKVVNTNYVQFGDVHGFEATAVVLDRNQSEISRAESMCLSDEDNWGMVAQYEWQDEVDEKGKKIFVEGKNGKKGYFKGKKVKIGEKAKPLFQLRSMAQTRAGARALRQVFAWVVVLAGYRPTPAEEMTGNEQPYEFDEREKKEPVTQPKRASEKQTETPKADPVKAETQPEAAKVNHFGEVTEVFGGVIQPPLKTGKENSLWMHLMTENGARLIVVPQKLVDDDMKVGSYLTVKGLKKNSGKVGDFWEVQTIMENPPEAQEYVSKAETEEVVDAEFEEVENPDAEPPEPEGPAPTIEGLKSAGLVTTAANLPASNGETIGMNHARHIHITASMTNKEKGTGFTDKVIEQICKNMNISGLRDLPKGLEKEFLAYANGESDGWKKIVGGV